MTMTQTETSIFDRIARGEFDGQLTQLFDALKDRRKYLHQQQGLENAATLRPGDRVLTSGLSPKYLNGLAGTVSPRPAAKAGSLMVDIDEAEFTGRYGKHVSIPAGCLTKTDPK